MLLTTGCDHAFRADSESERPPLIAKPDAMTASQSCQSLKFSDTLNSRGSPGCTVTPLGLIAAVGVTR